MTCVTNVSRELPKVDQSNDFVALIFALVVAVGLSQDRGHKLWEENLQVKYFNLLEQIDHGLICLA